MVITKISPFGVKITQGSTSFAINPSADKKLLSNGTFSADIVLLSSSSNGFDSAEHFIKKDDSTFIIDSPGEYERDELFIYGIASTTKSGGADSINTIYYLKIDDLDIAVLGAHEPTSLPHDVTETIDNVDVLIIPIAGDNVLSAVAANKLATKLEAKVIIPVGFADKKDANLLAFLDEFSHETTETDKVVLKTKDLTDNPQSFILL